MRLSCIRQRLASASSASIFIVTPRWGSSPYRDNGFLRLQPNSLSASSILSLLFSSPLLPSPSLLFFSWLRAQGQSRNYTTGSKPNRPRGISESTWLPSRPCTRPPPNPPSPPPAHPTTSPQPNSPSFAPQPPLPKPSPTALTPASASAQLSLLPTVRPSSRAPTSKMHRIQSARAQRGWQ